MECGGIEQLADTSTSGCRPFSHIDNINRKTHRKRRQSAGRFGISPTEGNEVVIDFLRPADALDRLLRTQAARPLLTWYDDATGERVELSVATAANWAAKTANMLVDDDVDAVRPDPPAQWLTAVAALGAWTAGVAVVDVGGVTLPGDPATFMHDVLPQPDALLAGPAVPVELTVPPLDLPPRPRLLSTLPLTSYDGLAAALLLPLAHGGSAVLVVSPDAAKLPARAAAERCTHTAGCDVDGLPRVL
jgi:hypothetical protein